MHNTSGIRDMLEIMRLGGADLASRASREICWTAFAGSAG